MNLRLFSIPDDPADWPVWLEREIVGMNLVELVHELPVFVEPSDEPEVTIDAFLGSRREDVLQSGLAVLSHQEIGRLFRQPSLLFDLQELVLSEGGSYWNAVPLEDAQQQFLARNSETILRQISGSQDDTTLSRSVTQPTSPAAGSTTRRRFVRWVVSVAAMLGLVLLAWRKFSPAPWGFDRALASSSGMSEPQFLNHCADVVEQDWKTRDLSSPSELSNALREFRDGCNRMIATEHAQLSEANQVWFRERCTLWRDRVIGEMDKLAKDPSQYSEVKANANDVIAKLGVALRTRAAAQA